jgi:hypothetical protein
MLSLIIRYKAFQAANGHWLIDLCDYTDFFALLFLRANPAAHRGKQVGFLDFLGSADEITFHYQVDESGDVNCYWATLDAGLFGALQAAFGFGNGQFLGKSQGDFIEV